MPNTVNDYYRSLLEDDLETYVAIKQKEFLEQLNQFKANMDDHTYHEFCAETFEGSTMAEAKDHFVMIWDRVCMAIAENSRGKLLQRLIKGAEMIEGEHDQKKRNEYKAAYNILLKRLESLGA